MKSLRSEEEKEVIGRFLETYKRHRCLWDIKHDLYGNRNIRNAAYNDLLNILKQIHPEATVAFLKKKIENMRSAYKREAKKVRDSESTGASTSQIYRPRLWYYEKMTFLEENENVKPERSMWDEEEYESDYDTTESPGSPAEHDPPSPPPRKKPRKALKKQKESLIDAPRPSLSSEDDWEIIGKSIGLQLKQLNDDQQAIANKLIAEIIFYGKRDRLTDSSSISLSPDI